MTAKTLRLTAFAAAATLLSQPAFAHHVMGGKMPGTFTDGLLSGLGHPVIGLDHFAALVAVGCLVVAGSVIVLGAIVLTHRLLSAAVALVLFVAVGSIHGYALGESIFGAEQAPLWAYLIGLAVIQSAIALAALSVARLLMQPDALRLRLVGADIAGIGLAILVQQLVPAV